MRIASSASAAAMRSAATGSAHHQPNAELTTSGLSVVAASAAEAIVSLPSPRSATLPRRDATRGFVEESEIGEHDERERGKRDSGGRCLGMRVVDEPSDRLDTDIRSDDEHGGRDPRLRAPLEALRPDGIALLGPEAMDEDDGCGGVQERGESEAGKCEARIDERDDERGRAHAAVPADGEARQADGRDELRGAVVFQGG